jgi:hypothetical protein
VTTDSPIELPDPARMTVEQLQAELVEQIKRDAWHWPTPRRKALRRELIRRLFAGRGAEAVRK